MRFITFIFGVVFLLGGIAYGQEKTPESEKPRETQAVKTQKTKLARAALFNSKRERVGIATLMETPEGVRITVQAYDLPPGLHGFHIHETGKCGASDFQSAGGHFNPFGSNHGLQSPKGHHAGDMQNILVGPEGTVTTITVAPLVTLGSGNNSLLDQDGSALVIHSGPDDYKTDPSGNSGDRIACGVVLPFKR